MVLPSGAKTTPRTSFLWPLNVCKFSEFEVLHVLTKSSRPAEANMLASDEKLSESTPPWCAVIAVELGFLAPHSHKSIFPALSPLAAFFPSLETANALMALI